MKRSYIILSVAVIFLLSCESKEDKIVAKDIKSLTQEESNNQPDKKDENKTIINRMGVSSKDGVITIDTNQAKDYIKDVHQDIKKKTKEFSSDIKNGTINASKTVGIEMNNSTLSIDFNKTKHFMQDMGGKVIEFTKDVKELASEFQENK
jgi:hypothetical protein